MTGARILFMGTPDFANFSLRALIEAGENVIGAVTQPDKPQGRGYTLTPPPVKRYAEEQGIPVYQPKTLRGEEFAALLDEIDPDMIIVAAYGKILPENVINYPKYGCINVHGSYLPQYRGAAPMQRAIIDGNKYTGVTIMKMDVGLDTGDMISRERIEIEDGDNFETIHDKIGTVGAALLVSTLPSIVDGTALYEKQDEACSSYAAKIEKSDCALDFEKSAEELHDLIRGLSPIPLSFTRTPDGKLLKVIEAKKTGKNTDRAAGTVVSVDGGIEVACGDGKTLTLLRVLPEGRSKMDASAFVRGRGIAVGDILKWS